MFKGMDTEGGKTAAGVLNGKAGEIEQMVVVLDHAINGFEWRGPDADRTRQSWSTEQVRNLKAVVEALQAFSVLIQHQVEEQEKVSAA